jgi:hypothetical protein
LVPLSVTIRWSFTRALAWMFTSERAAGAAGGDIGKARRIMDDVHPTLTRSASSTSDGVARSASRHADQLIAAGIMGQATPLVSSV